MYIPFLYDILHPFYPTCAQLSPPSATERVPIPHCRQCGSLRCIRVPRNEPDGHIAIGHCCLARLGRPPVCYNCALCDQSTDFSGSCCSTAVLQRTGYLSSRTTSYSTLPQYTMGTQTAFKLAPAEFHLSIPPNSFPPDSVAPVPDSYTPS